MDSEKIQLGLTRNGWFQVRKTRKKEEKQQCVFCLPSVSLLLLRTWVRPCTLIGSRRNPPTPKNGPPPSGGRGPPPPPGAPLESLEPAAPERPGKQKKAAPLPPTMEGGGAPGLGEERAARVRPRTHAGDMGGERGGEAAVR